MTDTINIVQRMREKAEAVATTVVELQSMEDAYAYALEVCEKKDPCQLLPVGSEKTQASADKIIAAPNLSEAEYETFATRCAEKGFICIREGLRKHLAGIDVGFTHVDLGIADTGSCVLSSNSENLRIASMVSEIHIAVLPKSKIVPSFYDTENTLSDFMDNGIHYTAFISGPSRTADIERVLALGVHGPLELHLILLEA